MRIGFTPEQEQLRQELRAYFAALMTPERTADLAGGGDYGDAAVYKDTVRQMGLDGWLTIGWPEEYGGRNRPMIEQLIFLDEASAAGAPVPFLTLNSIGPTIMSLGTPEQKAFYLPKIASGELHFAIGYSEPEAGTDLAALRTRAVREGDEYVVNGQKMWTSLVQYADYVWLACRTDPDSRRHRGLSVIMVPTTSPGFSWTPVPTMSGPTTSATFYDNVRVPAGNLIGEEHRGWKLITNQLNHERVALCSAAPLRTALREVRDWATETGAVKQEWVRLHLARVHAKTEFLKLVNWRIASGSDEAPSPAEASATKVFGTEFATEGYRLLMEVLGANGIVRAGSPGAVLHGRVERMHRSSLILTFGGGTNEIQRDIIARAGLGLPAAPR
ncbi:acyl-CoA dehydrogenase family protein [Lentzea sp. CC55]|uniref:acyl-CoA dehydrogenase family protein n=1 Tax=Lentzea sp. CC55 TaxID=2884909 RepID=UPI001F4747A6|nr:acyl-CoA dehydrogenase family protein [Lentzea sp. CC55]MCG8927004.1 acyl-CoA dehydrogenase family protein [Lentzea sp. CC55]